VIADEGVNGEQKEIKSTMDQESETHQLVPARYGETRIVKV
jgi:hypothetical protein